MLQTLITSGQPIADDWHYRWFTRGLVLGEAETIEEDALVPMFFPEARVVTVPGDARGVDGAAVPALSTVWMYPKDIYDVAVDWSGRQVLPVGATALLALEVVVTDPDLGDVTGTLVSASGVSGLISWVTIHNPTVGKTYTVRVRQSFNSGVTLDKYVSLEIRNPRAQALKSIFKYPVDRFPVAVPWTGRVPRAATLLGALAVRAYNGSDVDVSETYLLWSSAVALYSVGKLFGGSGGETVFLEFAQTFTNGRAFHAYAWLTVRTPPA